MPRYLTSFNDGSMDSSSLHYLACETVVAPWLAADAVMNEEQARRIVGSLHREQSGIVRAPKASCQSRSKKLLSDT